ncbi:MAG: recombinase family protein [Clostridiales bacterium]|nr:recombinase family protein [Clostridiales bacterium]
MRIGIYNHQHLRGGCPGCSQVYVKGMISDGMKCQNRAIGIYGADCEFINYTDLGDYPADNLDRPGYQRMMRDVENNKLDAIFVLTLDKISSEVSLVLETYKRCKEHHVALLTATDGKRAMDVLEKALEQWEKN